MMRSAARSSLICLYHGLKHILCLIEVLFLVYRRRPVDYSRIAESRCVNCVADSTDKANRTISHWRRYGARNQAWVGAARGPQAGWRRGLKDGVAAAVNSATRANRNWRASARIYSVSVRRYHVDGSPPVCRRPSVCPSVCLSADYRVAVLPASACFSYQWTLRAVRERSIYCGKPERTELTTLYRTISAQPSDRNHPQPPYTWCRHYTRGFHTISRNYFAAALRPPDALFQVSIFEICLVFCITVVWLLARFSLLYKFGKPTVHGRI